MSAAIAIEPKRKPRPVHSELLISLANGLELMLANGEGEARATAEWSGVMERERRRVRRSRIIGALAFTLVTGAVIGLVALAVSH